MMEELQNTYSPTTDIDTIRLKFLADINPKKSEINNLSRDMEISFVSLDDFGTKGEIKNLENRILDDVYHGYTYFKEGDIALAKITPSFENGKGAICSGLKNQIGFGTTEIHVLRPRSGISTRFLWYALRTKPFFEEGEAAMRGVAGQQRVPSEFVENHRIPDWDIDKQEEIADYLTQKTSQIDNLIEKKKQLVEVVNEKRASIIELLLKEAEAENEVRLKYLANFLAGYAFPSEQFTSNSEDVRLLRGVNIGVGEINWDEVAYWPKKEVDEYQQYLLEPDDVVLGMDRPWINDGVRVAQISESDCPTLLVQRVLKIRANSEIKQQYVRMALESERFKQYFEPITTGVSVPHISQGQVGDFRIPLPPKPSQEAILSRWNHFRKEQTQLIEATKRSIELLQEKRQALITAAVTGQIDITETQSLETETVS